MCLIRMIVLQVGAQINVSNIMLNIQYSLFVHNVVLSVPNSSLSVLCVKRVASNEMVRCILFE